MFISGEEIKRILEKYGALAWVRASAIDFDDPIVIQYNKADNFRNRPHFTAWRYKEPDVDLENAIIEAVRSFKGNVEWDIYVKTEGNRNWVIEPKKVIEYQALGKVIDYSAIDYLAKYEPEFGRLANQDVPDLASHMDKVIKEKIK